MIEHCIEWILMTIRHEAEDLHVVVPPAPAVAAVAAVAAAPICDHASVTRNGTNQFYFRVTCRRCHELLYHVRLAPVVPVLPFMPPMLAVADDDE